MNKQEFIDAALACDIKEDRVKQIEKIYKVSLNDEVSKLVSYADTVDFFDEERRALSFDEIVDASEELEVDTVELGIIPLIDAYDCTYIVYLTQEDKWARFSSVDIRSLSLVSFSKELALFTTSVSKWCSDFQIEFISVILLIDLLLLSSTVFVLENRLDSSMIFLTGFENCFMQYIIPKNTKRIKFKNVVRVFF